jgi:hypothetical protein
VDAELKKKYEFKRHHKLQHFYGRGGTDFSPFMLELKKTPIRERPAFVVFYTDGYGGIEEYVEQIVKERGQKWWDAFVQRCPPKTPEGIEMLWLLAEHRTTPEDFRKVAPFGHIAILPGTGEPEKEDEDEV